jgi:hypothetical protein
MRFVMLTSGSICTDKAHLSQIEGIDDRLKRLRRLIGLKTLNILIPLRLLDNQFS